MLRALLLTGAFGTAVVVSPLARAEAPADTGLRVDAGRVAVETDLWPAQHWFVATMALTAQIRVHRNVLIDGVVPWVVGSDGGAESGSWVTSAAFGDPTLGMRGVFKPAPHAALFGGISISVPTRFSRVGLTDNVLLVGTFSRGMFDMNRLWPSVLSFRFPLGAEVRLLPSVLYRGELTPVVMIGVGDFAPGAPLVMLEHADEIEVRAPFGLGGGLRLQGAFALTADAALSDDHAQLAIEPFVGYEAPGRGLFARLGLLVALDSPLGFGFREDRLAVVRTTLGGKF